MESILCSQIRGDSCSNELLPDVSLTTLPQVDALRLVVYDTYNFGGHEIILCEFDLIEGAILIHFIPYDHDQSLRYR